MVDDNKEPILIYSTLDGRYETEVTLQADTVWLTQVQMAELFGKNVRTINEHIKNIYEEEEVSEMATIRDFRIVQKEGNRQVTRDIEHYNLDVVISVGYRVKSKEGTHFRIWATNTLRDYLTQGYVLNQKRLQQYQQHLQKLEQTVQLFQQRLIDGASHNEAQGIATVIKDYIRTFVLLNQFDSERLPDDQFNQNIIFELNFDETIAAVLELKKILIEKGEASELFGNLKDKHFPGILQSITQSFDGNLLYPSIESQASHLLYFVIKDHPFSDGNKRIGAFLFIWFLERNKHHLKSNGELKINDNALAAIALLVAQSLPPQKELMIQLIMNLIKNETKG